MAKDYSKSLELSKRLIIKFGRQITLRKLNRTSVNPNEPWLGPIDPTTGGSSVVVYSVSVQPESLRKLGFRVDQNDLFKSATQIFITEPGEVDPENLEKYDTILDESLEYKILFVEKLRPSSLSLLYFIGVAR